MDKLERLYYFSN